MFFMQQRQLKQQFNYKIKSLEIDGDSTDDILLYNKRKRFFAKYDELLDKCKSGPTHLKRPDVAKLVANELHLFNGELYDLIVYSIMPNHVHILIDTSIQIPATFCVSQWESLDFEPLENIMKRIKGPSAVYSNRLLGLSGKFWQKESYDHYIRNEKEFNNVIAYILNNPVKAKIVGHWEEHPFTWVKSL